MGPLLDRRTWVVLGLLVGCDGVATREAAPVAVMAAAPAGPTKAEKAAKKALKTNQTKRAKKTIIQQKMDKLLCTLVHMNRYSQRNSKTSK